MGEDPVAAHEPTATFGGHRAARRVCHRQAAPTARRVPACPGAKLVERAERGPPTGGFVLYLAARLLNEPPFKLAWAVGADRVPGGALAGSKAALIPFNAEATPVLNAKTCEVRRGWLAHDSSRAMPRRRSAADHAERAMLFLTAQNLRRSGPELVAVQWAPMDHPGKSARSWATSLGGGSVTWSIPSWVTGCPPRRTLRGRGSVVWLTGPRPP